MRRFISFVLFLVLLSTMTFGALAVSYSDRGRYYLYITTADTQIYSLTTQTAEDGTITNTFTPNGTLPAGTPVSAGEVLDEVYQKVVYMDQSSSTHTVIIRKDVIKSNYVTLDFGGSTGSVRIPRPASANAGFIKDYLNYRGISVTDAQIQSALGIYSSETTPVPGMTEDTSEQNDTFPNPTEDAAQDAPQATKKPSSGSSSAAQKPKATPTPAPSVRESVTADHLLYLNHNGQLVQVAMKELGTARSVVTLNKQDLVVETADLIWSTNAADNERIGIIYAPKTGKVSLRKTSKKSSAVLQKLTAGTLVRVFDIGKTMTGIYVGDQAGYVLNSTIQLTGTSEDYNTGILTYNGSLTNTHRINFYTAAKESSKKIQGVYAGTSVVILGVSGTWTELDLEGYHGYILSKFVTQDEEVTPLSDLNSLLNDAVIEEEVTEEVTEEVLTEDSSGSDSSESVTTEVVSQSDVNTDKNKTDSDGYRMHRDPYN